VGGITGAGGRRRIAEMLSKLQSHLAAGDRAIDIIGFSRGSALALHFANRVRNLPGSPEVRFLGLWDTVPSFGLPGNATDFGWELALPDNVRNCFHALALDECRHMFPLHRLKEHDKGKLFEVWFRGVHSDIGGGNGNTGLSSIALNWMFRNALRCGLPIDTDRIAANAARMKPECPISIHKLDLVRQPFRTIFDGDKVHSSVVSCVDSGGRFYNNPRAGLHVVDDLCQFVARFATA
jgi:uncharacterized protein (DUF2235 family)